MQLGEGKDPGTGQSAEVVPLSAKVRRELTSASCIPSLMSGLEPSLQGRSGHFSHFTDAEAEIQKTLTTEMFTEALLHASTMQEIK